jgi:hypothetical protein
MFCENMAEASNAQATAPIGTKMGAPGLASETWESETLNQSLSS